MHILNNVKMLVQTGSGLFCTGFCIMFIEYFRYSLYNIAKYLIFYSIQLTNYNNEYYDKNSFFFF